MASGSDSDDSSEETYYSSEETFANFSEESINGTSLSIAATFSPADVSHISSSVTVPARDCLNSTNSSDSSRKCSETDGACLVRIRPRSITEDELYDDRHATKSQRELKNRLEHSQSFDVSTKEGQEDSCSMITQNGVKSCNHSTSNIGSLTSNSNSKLQSFLAPTRHDPAKNLHKSPANNPSCHVADVSQGKIKILKTTRARVEQQVSATVCRIDMSTGGSRDKRLAVGNRSVIGDDAHGMGHGEHHQSVNSAPTESGSCITGMNSLDVNGNPTVPRTRTSNMAKSTPEKCSSPPVVFKASSGREWTARTSPEYSPPWRHTEDSGRKARISDNIVTPSTLNKEQRTPASRIRTFSKRNPGETRSTENNVHDADGFTFNRRQKFPDGRNKHQTRSNDHGANNSEFTEGRLNGGSSDSSTKYLHSEPDHYSASSTEQTLGNCSNDAEQFTVVVNKVKKGRRGVDKLKSKSSEMSCNSLPDTIPRKHVTMQQSDIYLPVLSSGSSSDDWRAPAGSNKVDKGRGDEVSSANYTQRCTQQAKVSLYGFESVPSAVSQLLSESGSLKNVNQPASVNPYAIDRSDDVEAITPESRNRHINERLSPTDCHDKTKSNHLGTSPTHQSSKDSKVNSQVMRVGCDGKVTLADDSSSGYVSRKPLLPSIILPPHNVESTLDSIVLHSPSSKKADIFLDTRVGVGMEANPHDCNISFGFNADDDDDEGFSDRDDRQSELYNVQSCCAQANSVRNLYSTLQSDVRIAEETGLIIVAATSELSSSDKYTFTVASELLPEQHASGLESDRVSSSVSWPRNQPLIRFGPEFKQKNYSTQAPAYRVQGKFNLREAQLFLHKAFEGVVRSKTKDPDCVLTINCDSCFEEKDSLLNSDL